MTYTCHRCQQFNEIVNQCGCDPDNLPTRPGPGRVRSLTCAVCGAAARGRQWWNRDTGYGLCVACGDWLTTKRAYDAAELRRLYGVRGVHWDVRDATPMSMFWVEYRENCDGGIQTAGIRCGPLAPYIEHHETLAARYMGEWTGGPFCAWPDRGHA